LHRESAAGKKGAAGEEEQTGSNPTDRGKAGTKRHLLTDAKGIPLSVVLSGANRHDSKMLRGMLEGIVIGVSIPLEDEQRHLALDRGYDTPQCRETAQQHALVAHIPKKATEQTPLPPPGHPERHPPRRWVVEVAHSWFNRFRRLLIRWDKNATHYLGFVQLAATLIIWRKIAPIAPKLSG
jgi:putative transposase